MASTGTESEESDRRVRVCGRWLSWLLLKYYMGCQHPAKERVWGMLRRIQRHRRLMVGYADDGRITVDERDWIDSEILRCGSYEEEVWSSLAQYAEGMEIVWDVGAHIGTFAISALRDPRVSEVYAFEPDPIAAKVLRTNLSLNRGQYRIHEIGLSDRSEVRQIYRGPTVNTGLSSFVSRDGARAFTARCGSIDELVFEKAVPAPTLLKVDVEGWEGRVFRGAKRLLGNERLKAIVFEAVWRGSSKIADCSIWEQLGNAGYEVKHVQRPSGRTEGRENFLAVRKGGLSRREALAE